MPSQHPRAISAQQQGSSKLTVGLPDPVTKVIVLWELNGLPAPLLDIRIIIQLPGVIWFSAMELQGRLVAVT